MGTLDAADGSPESSRDEAPALGKGLRPIRPSSSLRLATTARFLESHGELAAPIHLFDPALRDPDSSSELSPYVAREAGRSIIFSIPPSGTTALTGLPGMRAGGAGLRSGLPEPPVQPHRPLARDRDLGHPTAPAEL